MRVLFVYPNLRGQLGCQYGLASLSAVLRAAGHETGLLNLNEAWEPPPAPEAFVARVRAFRPDLVGFSVVTPQYKYALDLAAAIKASLDVPLVFGGVHPTLVPEEVVREKDVDFVCVGEGEEALLELVEGLARGSDVSAIRNLWCERDGGIAANPVRPLPDLSRLPPPDLDLFDFDKLTRLKNGWVGLLASRGCPYRCSYCFNHRMARRYSRELGVPMKDLGYVRRVPVEAMIGQIRDVLDRDADTRMFIFDDDLFTHDPDYVRAFCARYRETADVPLTVNAHVLRFDADTARALAAAGCRIVKFGLESGSPRIRTEVMHRHMSDEAIAKAFAAAHDAGLVTSAFVMAGLPRETPEDLARTFDLLARIRPGRFRWSTFFPFPGTDAFEMAAADGSLDRAKMARLDNFFAHSCLDLGPEMNALLERIPRLFPWHVNARLEPPVGPRYARLVEIFMAMSPGEFAAATSDFRALDARMAAEMEAAGGDPYRIRFNDFMAVRAGAGAEDR